MLSPAACTVDLEARDPWPCSGDEDCDELHICLRSATGRFCQSPAPRCIGPACGVRDPGIVFDAELEPPPPPSDDGVPPDGQTPPDAGLVDGAIADVDVKPVDAAPTPDVGPGPGPETCPIRAVDPDALPTLSRGHLCLEELPLCVYEFASDEPASCSDLCSLLGLPCVGAGYNPTLFWCVGFAPDIEITCDDTDVRGLVCVCELQ